MPDHILHKPGPLTPEEFVEMRKHPGYGRDVIVHAEDHAGVHDDVILTLAKDIVYTHHEKWDGSGYPEGLQRPRHSDSRAGHGDRRRLRCEHDAAALPARRCRTTRPSRSSSRAAARTSIRTSSTRSSQVSPVIRQLSIDAEHSVAIVGRLKAQGSGSGKSFRA